MARSKGRGGYQRPSKPAAVPVPGGNSRTDGRVPALERTGLDYGSNKAVNDMQAAAPLNASQPSGGGGLPRTAPAGATPPQGVFGPSNRPGEPLTAGVDFGPGPGAAAPGLPDDPYLMLRVLASKYPNPQLEALVARLG